jgi:hypothetical protein
MRPFRAAVGLYVPADTVQRRQAENDMITITASSLKITQKPSLALVQPTNSGGQIGAGFNLSTTMEAVGTVTLKGSPGESGAGWNVGFLQAQWIETNWGAYRGLSEADGSVFVQRARPPARPRQACFDCITIGAPFYADTTVPARSPVTGGPALPFVAPLPANPTFPLTISVLHSDFPSDFFPFSRLNSVTGQQNLLSEAQLEFSFCFVLALKGPAGQLSMAKSVYWNVAWQSKFKFANAAAVPTITPTAGGNHANVGGIINGGPADTRFTTVLTTAQTTNCNAIADNESKHPNLKETHGWPLFDVRR